MEDSEPPVNNRMAALGGVVFRWSIYQLQCARIKESRKIPDKRIALLQNAIEMSKRELDMASEAQAWNELGNAFVERGQLQSGERAQLEAFSDAQANAL